MPRRYLCVIAGLLTQLAAAACLLLGTVAFALTMSNGDHGLAPMLIGWVIAALSGLISGSLVYRGSLVGMIMAALLDGLFGVVLLQVSPAAVLKMLSASDIETAEAVVQAIGVVMLVVGGLCLIAIPQGRKYAYAAEMGADSPAQARGFPAAAIPVTMMVRITPASRRRQWIAVVGAVIGVGSGIAVIASAGSAKSPQKVAGSGSSTSTSTSTSTKSATGTGSATVAAAGSATATGSAADAATGSAAATATGSAAATATGSATAAGSAKPPPPPAPVAAGPVIDTANDLVVAELKAIGAGDGAALAALAVDDVYTLGAAGDELGDNRAAFAAIATHDLGGAADVDSRYLQIGEWRDHAWIASEWLVGKKFFATSQLVAKVGNTWRIVAWSWANPMPDAKAEKLAASHQMATLKSIADAHDGPDALDDALRNALYSRKAFADAFSARDDGFNFGSAPGEHLVGGATIKKLFGAMNANLRVAGGIHTSGGNQWDKSQASGAWIGFGAANVDFSQPRRTRQQFRVFAVLIREDQDWQIVLTQFSNGT